MGSESPLPILSLNGEGQRGRKLASGGTTRQMGKGIYTWAFGKFPKKETKDRKHSIKGEFKRGVRCVGDEPTQN